jgi:hypothetical protein
LRNQLMKTRGPEEMCEWLLLLTSPPPHLRSQDDVEEEMDPSSSDEDEMDPSSSDEDSDQQSIESQVLWPIRFLSMTTHLRCALVI